MCLGSEGFIHSEELEEVKIAAACWPPNKSNPLEIAQDGCDGNAELKSSLMCSRGLKKRKSCAVCPHCRHVAGATDMNFYI